MNKFLDRLFTNNVSLVLLFLLIHLTIVYTKAIYFINPDKTQLWYDLPLAFIVAVGYSLVTIVNIRQGFNKRNNTIFSILDGIGVFIYYNGTQHENLYTLLISLFFAVLTGYGVYSIGHIANLKYNELKDSEQLKILQASYDALQISFEKLQKSAEKDKELFDVYRKGYYLYMKGRFNISKDVRLKEIAERFEREAGKINTNLLKFTIENENT